MDGIIDSMDSSLNKLWEVVEDRGTWFATVCGVTKSWRQLSDLTVTTTNQNRSRITNKEEKTSHTGEKKNGRRSKAVNFENRIIRPDIMRFTVLFSHVISW